MLDILKHVFEWWATDGNVFSKFLFIWYLNKQRVELNRDRKNKTNIDKDL